MKKNNVNVHVEAKSKVVTNLGLEATAVDLSKICTDNEKVEVSFGNNKTNFR